MTNKVYDQREDLHELKKFKNDKTSNSVSTPGSMPVLSAREIQKYCKKHEDYFNDEANSGARCPWCYVEELTAEANKLQTSLKTVCERTRNLIQPALMCLQLEEDPEKRERNSGAIGDIDRLLVILKEAEAVAYGNKS